MKENNGKKLKSLALVMVMLMAVLTVMIIVNVETTKAVPTAFAMTAPTDSKVYARGKPVYASWATSTNADWYDVTIKRFGYGEPAAGTVVTTVNTTNEYYSWSTFGREIGQYKIDVIAVQHIAANGTQYKLAATGNNKTVYVTWGTPGHTAFEGGNETIATNGDEILSSTECSIWPLEYHPTNTVDIVVNSSQSWSSSYKYFLWKPQYNGTADGGTYEFGWWGGRVASSYEGIAEVDPSVSDYTFDDVVLDRSGLWIIDIREDNPGNPNYDVTDADFSTWALSNSTVAGWFWVNASDDITLTLADGNAEFEYNSTGALTLTVTNSLDADEDSAIVDIRYDKNESSIYEYNIPTGNGGILDTSDSRYYLKNNSFAKQASSYRKYGFWNVGNYTAYAYIDMDTWTGGYLNKYRQYNMANSTSGNQHWNSTYGANALLSGADTTVFPSTRYNWTIAGPWDPPEYEAATKSIVVTTRTPYTHENNGTQNYGFEGEVNITIRESLGGAKFLDEYKINVQVFNPDDELVNEHVVITNYTHSTQGWICIYSATWGKDGSSIGGNGTWYAYIYIDENNDRGLDTLAEYTEEWNATVEWTVGRAGAITFDWVDDDGQVYGVDNWGFKNKNKDQIIPYIPDRHNVPLDVEFMLRGDDGSYFGDLTTADTHQSGNCKTIKECAENITISGNSLITGTLDKFPGYVDTWTVDNQTGYASNIWHVPIIPTMSVGGGTITVSYIAYNSSGSSTLNVGGDEYARNGSIVSALNQDGSSTFDIDIVNQTLTITAKNADEDPIPFHWARLYYMNDRGAINNSLIEQAYLGGSGSGSMNFNRTMQTTNQSLIDFNANGAPDGTTEIRAPRNLTIWVDGPNRMDGYALLNMERASDLEVELFPSAFLAGYKYDKFHVNCTIAGNSTATPNESAADKALFYVMIKDSAGNDVTTTILRCIDAINDLQAGSGHTTSAKPYSFTFTSNVFGIAPDTYTFYCYNNTHDSQGYNGTLTIEQVDVTHSFADGSTGPLIWQSDDNVSVTFTVTYNGEAIDGTLRVDNMTHKAAKGYNRTWALTNFTSTLTTTGSDQENTSITITDDMMDNGVFTMHDITPAHLDTGRFERNISYWFEPASPNDGSYARAIGRLPVRVPAVTPAPAYIPLEGTTTVTLLTTGRDDTPLPNVFVGLDGRGISIATTNGTTGSDGKLALSVNPNSAGNMDIHVGEDGRVVETKVVVTNWKIVIDAPVKANEGSDFIVTITELASGDAVEGASVTLSGVGTVTTDASGIASFSGTMVAPEVSSDIAYTLTAAKEGYVGATKTITIINVPKLTLTVKYPNEKGKGTASAVCVEQTFTVTVSKDDANPAVNAKVILQGDSTDYYTDGNGQVTIKAPSTAGAYTVTANFGSFLQGTVTVTVLNKDNDDCKTPGFELLTLLVALGVAFILLRRRRH